MSTQMIETILLTGHYTIYTCNDATLTHLNNLIIVTPNLKNENNSKK